MYIDNWYLVGAAIVLILTFVHIEKDMKDAHEKLKHLESDNKSLEGDIKALNERVFGD